MAGRKTDPNSRYRVYLHTDKKYKYGAVQEPYIDKNGRKKYKVVHLGKVDENNVFYPNFRFQLLPLSEREKYIFPEGWDISQVNTLNQNKPLQNGATLQNTTSSQEQNEGDTSGGESEETYTPGERTIDTAERFTTDSSSSVVKPSAVVLDQFNNKLYGSFWILEQISINCGLYDDLYETFEGNILTVHSVLSLAFYPYLSGKNFNRFAKWQNTHKTLLEGTLGSVAITKLTQSITDHHRMSLIHLRINRQPEGAVLDCDSTTRSGWGTCIVELYWGNNKDNPKLQNTVESYVYSLTTHEPVYYRSFPGYTNDISTVRTIIRDLEAIGIKDVIFIADRGYPSEENLATMVEADIPFLMCAKIGNEPVSPMVGTIQYDAFGVPKNMSYDVTRRLYYQQMEIPAYQSILPDETVVEMVGLKVNLFMNPRRRTDELSLIQLHLQEEEDILKKAVEANLIPENIKKYNALFKYYKVSLAFAPEDKEKKLPLRLVYELNEKKLQKERSLCGFFCSIMYKYDIDGLMALEIYKTRDEHEKNFDILKNQMYFYNQRNSSEDGREGRSFISFVGLIAISKFRFAWKDKMQDAFESSLDMLDEMEPIRFSQYTDGTSNMTTFTEKQVGICDACDVEPPAECIPPTIRKTREAKKNPRKRGRKPKTK